MTQLFILLYWSIYLLFLANFLKIHQLSHLFPFPNRNLQERLEKHGVDYHAAVVTYSSNNFDKEVIYCF